MQSAAPSTSTVLQTCSGCGQKFDSAVSSCPRCGLTPTGTAIRKPLYRLGIVAGFQAALVYFSTTANDVYELEEGYVPESTFPYTIAHAILLAAIILSIVLSLRLKRKSHPFVNWFRRASDSNILHVRIGAYFAFLTGHFAILNLNYWLLTLSCAALTVLQAGYVLSYSPQPAQSASLLQPKPKRPRPPFHQLLATPIRVLVQPWIDWLNHPLHAARTRLAGLVLSAFLMTLFVQSVEGQYTLFASIANATFASLLISFFVVKPYSGSSLHLPVNLSDDPNRLRRMAWYAAASLITIGATVHPLLAIPLSLWLMTAQTSYIMAVAHESSEAKI